MTPSDSAKHYAEDVLKGKIPAGPYVRLACQRFVDDLARDDWPYEYRAELADRAVGFMQLMPHTKGKWAAQRQRLKFEPWQCFVECNLFGWVRKDTGKRRFRESYEEEPRKNGKSARLAARGIYLFAADGEAGAEVYSGATTEKQAHEVFRPAWQMVQKSGGLRERFGIELAGNPKNPGPMYVTEDMSKFETIIGKPGDGSSPHAALIDEYHEHDTDQMVDAMQTGMGAREQPLLSIITTAGSNLGGPCYEKRRDVIRILEGQVKDETVFGIIFGIDEAERIELIQSSIAIGRLVSLCSCSYVNAETVAKLFAKTCAVHATAERTGRCGSSLQKDAGTTQTDLPKLRNTAALVTTRSLSAKTQNTWSDKESGQEIGEGKTRIELTSSERDLGPSSRTKNIESTSGDRVLRLCTEFQNLSTTICTQIRGDAAVYAQSLSKLYALITTTPPEQLEACFASNAMLRSAYSGILREACFGHSNTCPVQKIVKFVSELTIEIRYPPDDWSDPANLVKANPNFGISVFPDFLLAQLEQAKRSASKQNAFRTKHLNQWVGARTVWMNMLAWQRQRREFTLADLKGCPCWMAVDLASQKDVAALVMLFLKDGIFHVIPRFYAPEAAAEENDKYRQYATSGELTLTPGSMTDQAFIENDILELSAQVNLQDIGFDEWQANYLITRLQGTSLKDKIIVYNQTVKNMSAPMKEVEARIIGKTMVQDGNSMMTWMMGNVAAKIDAKENIYPRKESESDPRCKIDGPVSLIMAMGRAITAEPNREHHQIFFVG